MVRHAVMAIGLLFGVVLALSGCGDDNSSPADPLLSTGSPAKLFLGKVLTMDPAGSIASAVAVDRRGVIVAVGSEQAVRAAIRNSVVDVVQLQPDEVLLPGFVDPHMHLLPTILQNLPTLGNLAPCLPGPYAAANQTNCSNYIKDSLQRLHKKGVASNN